MLIGLIGLCCCCSLCGGGGYVFATNDKAAPYRAKMKYMMKKKTEETAVQKVDEGETENTLGS